MRLERVVAADVAAVLAVVDDGSAGAELRGAAFGGLDSSLSRLVQERLREGGQLQVQDLALDGIRALSAEALGSSALRIKGAFYLLEERGHRFLPFDAVLCVDRGKVSTVRVGSDSSIFALAENERDFAAWVERAELARRLEIRLLS